MDNTVSRFVVYRKG